MFLFHLLLFLPSPPIFPALSFSLSYSPTTTTTTTITTITVVLCQIMNKMSPELVVKYKAGAEASSFFARDNISNFISAAKKVIQGVLLFEPDDLVGRKNDRLCVSALMNLARAGVKYGVEPPLLVSLELEIEKIKEDDAKAAASPSAGDEDDDEGDDENAQQPPPSATPSKIGNTLTVPREAPFKTYVPADGDDIDAAVARLVNQHKYKCPITRCVIRNKKRRRDGKKGEYLIGKPPKVFVRLVKQLVLVRVNADWMGFHEFMVQKAKEMGGSAF